MNGLDKYQKEAVKTATYPQKGYNVIYPVLGLAGEAGEVAEKVKKLWRNCGYTKAQSYSAQSKKEIMKELGDVLWYIAAICEEMQVNLSEVAEMNITKLKDRQKRNVIKSEGDNR